MTTYKGLIIRPGKKPTDTCIERIDIHPAGSGSNHIHELIGDFFSSAFFLKGYGSWRQIIAYCDDMGAYKPDLPWNVVIDNTILREAFPIKGPLVITGGEGPDIVSMLEVEMAAFRLWPPRQFRFEGGPGFMGQIPAAVMTVPVLTFLPGYDR